MLHQEKELPNDSSEREAMKVVIILPIKGKMAIASNAMFLRILLFLSSPAVIHSLRFFQMTTNFELVQINRFISGRQSNSNFAYHFVIY